MTDTTYIKVLSLHEGAHAKLSFLLTPVTSNTAVSHHTPIPHSGVHVEGNVPRSAHHKVDAHAAIQDCLLAYAYLLILMNACTHTQTHLSAP